MGYIPADGKSAYEVAVENGFVGTEAQWLESLKGEDGVAGATDRQVQKETLETRVPRALRVFKVQQEPLAQPAL